MLHAGQESRDSFALDLMEPVGPKLDALVLVLLARRWLGERSYAWATRFRRLAKGCERLPETVAGLHFVAFACLLLQRLVLSASISP